MDKPLLKLKPKEELPIAPTQSAIPPKPKPVEQPGVEARFMGLAIKNERLMQFVHTDGTITEGIITGLDRYVLEIEGGILLHNQAIKITRFIPLKDA